MDRLRNVVSAAALASLAGGPLLAVTSGIGSLLSGHSVLVDLHQVTQVSTVILMLTVAGWFVAIVPNMLGTIALGWLGRSNVGMRLPAAWAIVGAVAAGTPTWAMSGPFDTWHATPAMTGIGAISALLCRARVRWDDAAALPTADSFTPVRPPATP